MFRRHAGKGQCFFQPRLATRECTVGFEFVDGASPSPRADLMKDFDPGSMLYDINAHLALPQVE